MSDTYQTSALASIMFFGDVMTKPVFWPGLLQGEYDRDIALGLFMHVHKKHPENVDVALADEQVKQMLENAKGHVRHAVQCAINGLAEEERAQREEPTFMRMRREMQESAARMQKQHKQFVSQHAQAPEGTVKELAAKYGKSIGEIRRMKAEGRLHELAQETV